MNLLLIITILLFFAFIRFKPSIRIIDPCPWCGRANVNEISQDLRHVGWEHQTKKGEPDKRFSKNRRILSGTQEVECAICNMRSTRSVRCYEGSSFSKGDHCIKKAGLEQLKSNRILRRDKSNKKRLWFSRLIRIGFIISLLILLLQNSSNSSNLSTTNNQLKENVVTYKGTWSFAKQDDDYSGYIITESDRRIPLQLSTITFAEGDQIEVIVEYNESGDNFDILSINER